MLKCDGITKVYGKKTVLSNFFARAIRAEHTVHAKQFYLAQHRFHIISPYQGRHSRATMRHERLSRNHSGEAIVYNEYIDIDYSSIVQ